MKPNSELKTTWLYGNRKRMKIDSRDDLLDIFLDYRANILSKCSAPLSGWKHHLELMVCLLENPEKQYHEYLNSEVKRDDDCLKEEKELLAIANQQTNQEKKEQNICKQNEWKRRRILKENRFCFKEGNKSKYDKQEKKDFLFHENRIKKIDISQICEERIEFRHDADEDICCAYVYSFANLFYFIKSCWRRGCDNNIHRQT